MNAFEMELHIKDDSFGSLHRVGNKGKIKGGILENRMIKRTILYLSDALIGMGLRLHNIYQPTIEATLGDYCEFLLENTTD